MSDFTTRFAAFADEAQALKDDVDAQVRAKLAEADALLGRLSEAGIPYRIELPMAVGTRLVDLRIKAGFQRDLK